MCFRSKVSSCILHFSNFQLISEWWLRTTPRLKVGLSVAMDLFASLEHPLSLRKRFEYSEYKHSNIARVPKTQQNQAFQLHSEFSSNILIFPTPIHLQLQEISCLVSRSQTQSFLGTTVIEKVVWILLHPGNNSAPPEPQIQYEIAHLKIAMISAR